MAVNIYLLNDDRERMTVVNDKEVQELFNEAKSFDKSLLISESNWIDSGGFLGKDKFRQEFNIYHDVDPERPPYQAQQSLAGSGSKRIACAYLYGIINGALYQKQREL